MGAGANSLMSRIHQRAICVSSGLAVPLLTLLAPNWLSLSGIGPCWVVLWLLPCALEEGPLSGIFSGFCQGLILDGVTLGGPTHIPILILLGFWWGRLGRRGIPIDGSLNLGLLSWIGSVLVGLSLWIQTWILESESSAHSFQVWGLHTVLAQGIITGLMAPIACSWLLLRWRKRS